MRTLSFGVGKEGSQLYTYIHFNQLPLPTIFDYEIVILNLPNLDEHSFKVFESKKQEFQKFFESGGICFVILAREMGETMTNYSWCPFKDKLKIENKEGETFIVIDRKAKFLFDSVRFFWNCYFSEIKIEHKILATNRTKDPVSIVVPYHNGYCVFLPRPILYPDLTNLITLHELLMKRGLELIPEKEDKQDASNLPGWASSLATKQELSLIKTLNEINRKLGKYAKFKQLYWQSGDNLNALVTSAFEELGFAITRLPKETHADFEVKIDENLTGVCEVKGLLGNATIQDLRQLLEYYTDQRDIEKRNVKGIFVVNHYRTQEPDSRGAPATRDAMDLIRKYNFKLITTKELYGLLVEFWEMALSKEDIRNRIFC